MEQGSQEWIDARCGIVTASRLSDVMAGGKGATRLAYMTELAVERITGRPYEGYRSAVMDRGNELEASARANYTLATGNVVEETGFFLHPTIDEAGASPDGLIGEDGLWEGKAPTLHVHGKNLMRDTIPPEYRLQVQWQMACTGREWCDFTSFNPDMPSGLDLWTVRVDRDDDAIAEAEDKVRAFLDDLRKMVADFTAKRAELTGVGR